MSLKICPAPLISSSSSTIIKNSTDSLETHKVFVSPISEPIRKRNVIVPLNIQIEEIFPLYVYVAKGSIKEEHVDWEAEQTDYISKHQIPESYARHFKEVASEYTSYIALSNSSSMQEKAFPAMGDQSPTKWTETLRVLKGILDVEFLLFRKVALYPLGPLDFVGDESEDVTSITLREPCDIQSIFYETPNCRTPILTRLEQIIEKHPISEKKALILIPIDSKPTDCLKEELRCYLIHLQISSPYKERIAINFIMCTEDAEIFDYYSEVINNIPMTEIHKSYDGEKRETEKKDPSLVFKREVYWTRQLLFMFSDIDEKARRKIQQKEDFLALAQSCEFIYEKKNHHEEIAPTNKCCIIS